jgi:hypothetical protein
MEAEGIALAVAEVSARYHHPARYDEEVVVLTCLVSVGSRGMVFSYEIRRASDGVLLVSGITPTWRGPDGRYGVCRRARSHLTHGTRGVRWQGAPPAGA